MDNQRRSGPQPAREASPPGAAQPAGCAKLLNFAAALPIAQLRAQVLQDYSSSIKTETYVKSL
jgi:hypothetical protein